MTSEEIEQARLENDKQQTFLQQWDTDTQPIHEMILKSWDNGHAFAKLSIQTMFYLNGGALIAFPTFTKLANVSFSYNLSLSLASVFSFIIGLICISITTVVAYFTCIYEAKNLFKWQEARKNALHLMRSPPDKKDFMLKQKNEAEQATKEGTTKSERLRWTAIIFGIFSLIMFIVGTLFAAAVLTSVNAQQIPSI